MPLDALEIDPDEYAHKSSDIAARIAALKENNERMQQCILDVVSLMGAITEYLHDYLYAWLDAKLQETAAVSVAIDSAIEELESSLEKGRTPSSPLAQTLLTAPLEQLQIFSYSVTPPDLATFCSSFVTTRLSPLLSTLPQLESGQLAGRLALSPPQRHEPPAAAQLLAFVDFVQVSVVDFASMEVSSQLHNLPFVWMKEGCRFVWIGKDLFCSGGDAYVGDIGLISLEKLALLRMDRDRGMGDHHQTSLKAAYLFHSKNEVWDVSRLPNMDTGRHSHGLWWLEIPRIVLALGGKSYTGCSNTHSRQMYSLNSHRYSTYRQ